MAIWIVLRLGKNRSAETLAQFENRQNVQLTCHTRLRRPTERQPSPIHTVPFSTPSSDFYSLSKKETTAGRRICGAGPVYMFVSLGFVRLSCGIQG